MYIDIHLYVRTPDRNRRLLGKPRRPRYRCTDQQRHEENLNLCVQGFHSGFLAKTAYTRQGGNAGIQA